MAVAEIESSKSINNVDCEADGYFVLNPLAREGAKFSVGETVALITSRAEVDASSLFSSPREETLAGAVRFSKRAVALIEQFGIYQELFRGMALVRESDVQRMLQGKQKARAERRESEGLILLGGGGHAKMCIDILRQMHTYRIAGILDPRLKEGESVMEVPVLGDNDSDEQLQGLRDSGIVYGVNALGGIRNHFARQELYLKFVRNGFIVPNLLHPSAIIEPSAQLGSGNQIMAGAIIGSHALIGDNCIVNSGAIVTHDCRLSDNVHVAPGAILGGEVSVGPHSLIGMGVTVYLGVKIGSNTVIRNGAAVFEDVPDGTIYRGAD